MLQRRVTPYFSMSYAPEPDLFVRTGGEQRVDYRREARGVLAVHRASPCKPAQVVTAGYHMPRAIGVFRKAGFAVEPYPVDWRVGGRADLASFTNFSVDGLARTDTGSVVRSGRRSAVAFMTGPFGWRG